MEMETGWVAACVERRNADTISGVSERRLFNCERCSSLQSLCVYVSSGHSSKGRPGVQSERDEIGWRGDAGEGKSKTKTTDLRAPRSPSNFVYEEGDRADDAS